MFASFKPWRVVASFAFVGWLLAVPPITSFLFAAVGIATFLVSPATIVFLLHRPPLEMDWRFFILGGALNAALYAAYGRLLVHLSKRI